MLHNNITMDIQTIIHFFILLLRFIIELFFICAFYFRYQFFILTFVNDIFPFNQYISSSYRNYRNSYNYDYLDININGQIFPLIFSKIATIRSAESLCFLKAYGKSPKWFSPIFVI